MIANQKKRENMEIKEIYHRSPSKRSFANRIHSLLKRADARGSADIIYLLCDAYLYFAGQACRWSLTSKSRSRTEYLIPTDNMLVFD